MTGWLGCMSAVRLQLNAAQDINLLASADTASQRSSHSSSASSGLGIGMNSGSPGIALNLDVLSSIS